MKKIAIVTIVTINYGNRLQNYALQNVLEKQGFSVSTLRRVPRTRNVKSYLKILIQKVFQMKGEKFRQFDSHIHFAEEAVGRDAYPADIGRNYDYFVSGSDQVWNPYYDFVAGKCDFLTFAENDQKISYAASFGVSEIPPERREEYTEYLKNFRAISVRESQGAQIVEDLTGRAAAVVLDPTLLLEGKEWEKVEKKPRCCPKRKYVLVYALGEKSNGFQSKIEQLKKEYEIFDVRSVQRNGKELPIGPAEFLYLIKNAKIILTDSFHATVFSIIFHKRFVTYNRTGLNMNSRIESLSEMLGIEECLNEFGDLVCEAENDYKKIDEILDVERGKSIEFLNRAFKNRN